MQFMTLRHAVLGSFIFSLLAACNPQSGPSKSAQKIYDFHNQHIFFNLDQELSRESCKITGEIPSWLTGTFLRNGPAKFSVGDQRVASNFDGAAMLHAFEFTPGDVLYSNRFLRSEQYYVMTEAKSLNFNGFAQDPCPQVFKNQTSHFIPKESQDIPNADVSIQEYANKMVALTEIPLPVMFDPKTLDTLGIFDYEDSLAKGQWESAHPQHDMVAEETVNYYVRFGRNSSYVIWSMPGNHASRQVIAEIPVDFPGYMHSFALTENYVILVEFPFVVNPQDLSQQKKPFIFNYKWQPERGTTFYIVNRSSGELLAKIKEAPFYCWHHVNAYDEGDKIFIDMATYKNADSVLYYAGASPTKKEIETSQRTRFERFTINLTSHKMSRETIGPKSLELPRIRSDRVAHKYRYCYAIDADAQFPDSLKEKGVLHKFDVMQKTCKSWSEEGCVPSEPVFVPRPNSETEDDGVVLSVVLDMIHSRSFLLMLDAHDFIEIARAEAPHAIPFGIHGLWKP